MNSDFNRSVDYVVDTIKYAKERGRGCSLLVGAGCSVKAGIPTAAGLVEEIRKRWPQAYDLAPEKTYFKCMEQVVRGQRRDLIAEYVDQAKINWAHISIALLVKEGYVDRVLTTNFDRLVVRACALLGEFPAVYDFAASQFLKTADIPDKAIFHLHGQRTGFILIIDEKEANEHFQLLGPVFQEALQGRVWIVVGYSGENDPVFEHLAQVPCFDHGLFWVGYQDNEPGRHVRERLLVPGKGAYHIKGYDADSFFVTLATKLGLFPPDLIARPFTHLNYTLEMLTPFSIPGQDVEKDVTHIPRQWIRSAIEEYERRLPKAASFEVALADVPDFSGSLVASAQGRLMAGDYEGVVSLLPKYQEAPSPELADTLAWAFNMQGLALGEQAITKSGDDADRLYQLAGEKFQAALLIKPDMHAALNNWGTVLLHQASTKTGDEADHLYQLAGEKFQAALLIKPDKHEALSTWGLALADQAKTKTGAEADQLWQLAGDKYQAALQIKPDLHETLNNWGLALHRQAITKAGDEADRLYQLAGDKFQAALLIKPDMHAALNNWGLTLADQASTKSGDEANRLLQLAGDKYQAALEIKPEKHEALNNWGLTLADQAKTKAGPEADHLWQLAGEKYQAALKIKPELYEALNNWGNDLYNQAHTKYGPEADRFYQLAGEKYQAALAIKPDMREALYNWGSALSDQAQTKSGEEADRLFQLAGEKYQAALEIKPDMHVALNNWGLALLNQAQKKSGHEADQLFDQSWATLSRAEEIKPGSGSYNLACLCAVRGHAEECRKWLENCKKYRTLPHLAHLHSDPDLDSVRQQPWFQEFLATLS